MSAKTSTQPGRRTPLSLSGTLTKSHPIKSGNNGGNNANGHTASNSSKQDNKLQQQNNEQQTSNNSDTKENPNKKQQPQTDKKQQQNYNKISNQKNQNGNNSSNKQQQSTESKQLQQQNKDKQQSQNGKDNNKVNEKDKKENPENSDKLEKIQDKTEKETTKLKEERKMEQSSEKTENKKDEKKSKDLKDSKDDKKEVATKIDEQTEPQSIKSIDKNLKEENSGKSVDQKTEEKIDDMEVKEGEQSQQKLIPVTPKSNSKANKSSTPVNKTPTRVTETTPQKSTPTNTSVKTTPVTKREVTTAIDDNDIEMEPLAIESSPIKSMEEVVQINIAPSATSTPGKILLPKRNSAVPKSDVQLAMQTVISSERPKILSQISGRKSIRPISDYTPSKFQSNAQFRESYRRINTELDVTNTSMNVTVGSEVPNNLSFSFFGRGRKRDRTPPQHSQSAIGELQTDMEISPPKRARLDMHGFFSVVSSPLTLLRNRFSKASLQSSTPVKLQHKLNTAEDEIEVQNVSGVSVHEEIAKSDREPTEPTTSANENKNATVGEEAQEMELNADMATPTLVGSDSEEKEFKEVSLKCEKTCGKVQKFEQSDIKITETPLQPAIGDPMAKNKRCIVM